MTVKVCGMRHPENIRAVSLLSVDWIGLIFHPQSKRYVDDVVPADIVRATGSLQRIGVFVDAPLETMLENARQYDLHGLQLHGDESPELLHSLRQALPNLMLIKAFRVGEKLPDTSGYAGLCDLFLFDASGPQAGGNGYPFAWELLEAYRGETPFLLSGGLGPGLLDELRRFTHPKLRGIDLNSRFESEPGRKDVGRLDHFLEACIGQGFPIHLNAKKRNP